MAIRASLLNQPLSAASRIAAISNEFGKNGGSKEYNSRVNTYFDNNWKTAFESLTNLHDIIAGIKLSHSISSCIGIRKFALKFVKTGQDYFDLYEIEINSPNKAYILELKKAMAEDVDFFISLKPSVPMAQVYNSIVRQVDLKASAKVRDYIQESLRSRPIRSALQYLSLTNVGAKCVKLLMPQAEQK